MEYFKGAKYSLVANKIIEDIKRGNYIPGETIPSERQLIESFQVSRITIRKAIDELVIKGFLHKVHGKGTFVKSDIHRQNLFSLTSCKNDIISQGMIPSTKVIFSGIVNPNSKQMEIFNLEVNEKLFKLERIYYADNNPVNYTTTFLPIKYLDGIEKIDFSTNSLYEILETKYNIHITKANRTVEAIIPNEQVTKSLELEKGQPVLLFNAITYALVNKKEIPIENFRCNYRNDLFKFYISQVRD